MRMCVCMCKCTYALWSKLTKLGLDWAGECKNGVICFPDNVVM